MNKPTESIFATRPTVTLELPLANTRILHPEQVILKIGDRCLDLGAFCYALRSHEKRKPSQPCQVVLGSFIKQRPNQMLQFMKALSRLITDSGMAPLSVSNRFDKFKLFLDWADSNNLHDCLSGGNATRNAYLAWVEESYERYRLQEISGKVHNRGTLYVREFLDALTGINDLHSGTRKAKSCNNPNGGTAPLALGDFVHAVALNQALFDGLCDLVLEQSPFPYKMVLPSTLGWAENHLWIFPANLWRLPPHQWGAEREKLHSPCWAHDYSAGRLATPDEIAHRYGMRPGCPLDQRRMAKQFIALAQHRINVANADVRDRKRIMLGMIAHNAFLFLFFSNAGANVSVAREIETHGNIRPTTLNQQYKSIKFRAGAKLITLVVPASFMPSLRRFMELRRYLLNGKDFPYLFFTLGQHNAKPPRQIGQDSLKSLYDNMLRAIDPQLPLIGPRKLRASMADWYQRHHDASVTAKVLQNSERTVQRNYDAGSVIDHCDELSLFLKGRPQNSEIIVR